MVVGLYRTNVFEIMFRMMMVKMMVIRYGAVHVRS